MRKAIQRQMTEIIKTMIEGTEYVSQNIDNADVCRDIFGSRLGALTSISENIKKGVSEKRYKEYSAITEKTAKDLEELKGYNKDLKKINELNFNVRKSLYKLLDKLTEEEEAKLEIVFLPYKASMWDSLESVFLAADKDERCNAYVVPIPYYDKNPDGSFGEMHYEGNEFPDYVPINDWKKFDLSRLKPDAIYIHNAYDQYNYVTSVHPMFYSSELKKHTDMLVYIPYFVTANNSVPRHFCSSSGVFNSTVVITQSEGVNRIYKNVFIESLIQGNRDNEGFVKKVKEIADYKFLPLGSPKIDKVLTTDNENIIIPQEWEKLIKRPDGTRKKVIFYNTTIAALLKHRGRYIEKIKSVFSEFKRNKDIVLLWRPHPLLKSTINSMASDLSEEYDRIVEKYREEKWGIYDDTADMDRAIFISDGYFGDRSSVVELYKQTNKPIMIQNAEMV